jgi:para-nitrobenzyl esterase
MPPIGNLRFRDPVPYRQVWNGVRDATKYGSVCLWSPLLPFVDIGTEDCLFANVYSPDLRGNLPVLVFIYG